MIQIKPYHIAIVLIGFLVTIGTVLVAPTIPATTNYISTDNTVTGRIDNTTTFVEMPIRVQDDANHLSLELTAIDGDLDTMLYLLDSNRTILAENDDFDSSTNSRIDFPSVPRGDYSAVITRFGGEDGETLGAFELSVDFVEDESIPSSFDVSPQALSERGFPDIAPRAQAAWTIIAYYGADTDLEAAILNDLNEFEMAGGSTSTVRIIALVDRHPGFTDSNEDWSTTRLFEIMADKSNDSHSHWPPTIDTPPLADLGDLDTGSGETLAQFLTWSLQRFPAERYVLSFSSQGAAWQGVIADYTSDTIISLPELRQAMDTALATANLDSFDILINDACSMSSIEYHQTVAQYFDLSIASPEIVVDPALSMTVLVQTLNENPDANLVDLSRQLIDIYIQDDAPRSNASESPFLTQAITDLREFSHLNHAIERFALIFNENPALHTRTISIARENTYTYSFFMGDNTLIDLGDFMEQVIMLTTDAALIDAAQDVLAALEDVRLYGGAGSWARTWTSYYNIYFPPTNADFDSDYLSASPLIEWGQMLRNYYANVSPRHWISSDTLATYHPIIEPDVTVTGVYPARGTINQPPTILLEVAGRGIASGHFTVDMIQPDSDTLRVVSSDLQSDMLARTNGGIWPSGVSESQITWSPLLTIVTDGTTSSPELLLRTGATASLEGRYREPATATWYDVTLRFNDQGIATSAVSRTSSGALATIQISAGSEFQAYQHIVTPSGQVKTEPGNIYLWPLDGLTMREAPAPTGDYRLGFLFTSFGGIQGFDAVTIPVEEVDDAPQYIGQTDFNSGLTYQVPTHWQSRIDTSDQVVFSGASTSTTLRFRRLGEASDIQEAWATASEFSDIEITGTPQPVSASSDRYMAVEFTLNHYDENDWRREGMGLIVVNRTEDDNHAILFEVVSFGNDRTERETFYSHLRDTLITFDPTALGSSSNQQWVRQTLASGTTYSIPVGWVLNPTGEASTFTYSPDGEFSQHFITIQQLTASDPQDVLSHIIDDLGPDIDVESRDLYQAELIEWHTAQYVRETSMGTLIGRIYATTTDSATIVVRMEAPNTDEGILMYRDAFEIVVDSFVP